ncbi:uncharacterized protein LOC142552721 [Primulina tabacum]|uniref:uncharacterized protein LOC142552721 n=1 Tax=Primulina tabacum TaxID=48773 RepID=UPI003F5A21C7
MSTLRQIKIFCCCKSLPSARLFQHLHLFASTGDGRNSDYPPEPIPNWSLRRQTLPDNPKFPKSNLGNENENLNSCEGIDDDDFVERFKLGLDLNSGDTKLDSANGRSKPSENAEPLLPPHGADVIFKNMKKTRLIPNAVAMLDGLCKDGLEQEAMKLFGLIRENGSMPEVVVYTAVVEGFCKACNFEDAVRIFKKMQSNDVVPNAHSYGLLIRALCRGKRLEDAFSICIEMLEAGHSPNLATFIGLVDKYCGEKDLEAAGNVIQAMKEKGFSVEEKAVEEYLEKKGPFSPFVWKAILGKEASKRTS